jgi:hypothetical protein
VDDVKRGKTEEKRDGLISAHKYPEQPLTPRDDGELSQARFDDAAYRRRTTRAHEALSGTALVRTECHAVISPTAWADRLRKAM